MAYKVSELVQNLNKAISLSNKLSKDIKVPIRADISILILRMIHPS